MTMRDRNGQSEVESTVVEKKKHFSYSPIRTSSHVTACWLLKWSGR